MYRLVLYPVIAAIALSGFLGGRWLELSGVLHRLLESGGTAVGVPERVFREPPGQPPPKANQEPETRPDDGTGPTSTTPDTGSTDETSPTPTGKSSPSPTLTETSSPSPTPTETSSPSPTPTEKSSPSTAGSGTRSRRSPPTTTSR